jgi:hypothetical protein
MIRGFVRSLTVLAFLLAAFAADTRAQAVYGSIAGTVSDPSGAFLPGVSVTVTSVERKTSDTVVTNETGHYVKERLLPGTYEVKIELSGFKQRSIQTFGCSSTRSRHSTSSSRSAQSAKP